MAQHKTVRWRKALDRFRRCRLDRPPSGSPVRRRSTWNRTPPCPPFRTNRSNRRRDLTPTRSPGRVSTAIVRGRGVVRRCGSTAERCCADALIAGRPCRCGSGSCGPTAGTAGPASRSPTRCSKRPSAPLVAIRNGIVPRLRSGLRRSRRWRLLPDASPRRIALPRSSLARLPFRRLPYPSRPRRRRPFLLPLRLMRRRRKCAWPAVVARQRKPEATRPFGARAPWRR